MIITSGGIGQYVTIRAWSADGRLQADHPVGRLGEPPHCVPAAQCPAATGVHACSCRCCCRQAAAAWVLALRTLPISEHKSVPGRSLPACSHMWHQHPVYHCLPTAYQASQQLGYSPAE